MSEKKPFPLKETLDEFRKREKEELEIERKHVQIDVLLTAFEILTSTSGLGIKLFFKFDGGGECLINHDHWIGYFLKPKIEGSNYQVDIYASSKPVKISFDFHSEKRMRRYLNMFANL